MASASTKELRPSDEWATTENVRHVGLVFVALMLTMLLSSMDQTVFSTALPTIVGELHAVDQQLWVTTAYMLASTIVMPIYGRLGDAIGRKWLFVVAIGLFVIGSVFGGLTDSMAGLIAARAIQGLGGGGLIILSQAIIADIVPPASRGRYLGLMGATFGLASVAGPMLGGWLTEGPGWRWAFWLNVPIGLLAIAAVIAWLKQPAWAAKARVDVAGIVTMAVAVTALVGVGSLGGTTFDWNSPVILGLVAVLIVFVTAFVLVERRAAEPIIPLQVFRSVNFNLATLASLVLAVCMFGALSYLPTYLQMSSGLDATGAGLMMVPMVAGMALTSTIGGNLASRTGHYKWMPIAGSASVALGLLILAQVTTSSSLWLTGVGLSILGIGLGLGMQILVLIVQNSFPYREVGTVTAANNFFREIGASLGSAIVGAVFTSRLSGLLADALADYGTSVDANSLTPAAVEALPEAIRSLVVTAYNQALMPVLGALAPVALGAAVLLCFVKAKPLQTSNSHDA